MSKCNTVWVPQWWMNQATPRNFPCARIQVFRLKKYDLPTATLKIEFKTTKRPTSWQCFSGRRNCSFMNTPWKSKTESKGTPGNWSYLYFYVINPLRGKLNSSKAKLAECSQRTPEQEENKQTVTVNGICFLSKCFSPKRGRNELKTRINDFSFSL